MLREVQHVSQVPGEPRRRCFASEILEAVFWYETDGSIHGFQLSYDPEETPRALTWTPPRGFVHAEIDTGDEDPMANRSPQLRPGGFHDRKLIRTLFEKEAPTLPEPERLFIASKLDSQP